MKPIEPWKLMYHKLAYHSQSSTLSALATPEEIRQAAVTWGKDSGWVQQAPRLAFEPAGIVDRGVSVEVDIDEGETHVLAVVTAVLPYEPFSEAGPYQHYNYSGLLGRVARMFASGVALVLEGQGIEVACDEAVEPDRIRRVLMADKISLWVLLPALAAGIAGLVVGLSAAGAVGLRGKGLMGLAIFMWFLAILTLRVNIRSRSLGLTRDWTFYFTPLLIACTAGFAVWSVYG